MEKTPKIMTIAASELQQIISKLFIGGQRKGKAVYPFVFSLFFYLWTADKYIYKGFLALFTQQFFW